MEDTGRAESGASRCAPSVGDAARGSGAASSSSGSHLRDTLEENARPARCFDSVIAHPIDPQTGKLVCCPRYPKGGLGSNQKEPGSEGEVDGLSSEHAPQVRHVLRGPVYVTEPAHENLVAHCGIEVDDRELVCPINGQQIDLAPGRAGYFGVDLSQPFA